MSTAIENLAFKNKNQKAPFEGVGERLALRGESKAFKKKFSVVLQIGRKRVHLAAALLQTLIENAGPKQKETSAAHCAHLAPALALLQLLQRLRYSNSS